MLRNWSQGADGSFLWGKRAKKNKKKVHKRANERAYEDSGGALWVG